MVVFVAILGIVGLPRGHVSTGDTPKLVRGTRVALHCMDDGRWTRCGTIDAHLSGVREFPVLQYLPVAALVQLGWSDRQILRGLGVLSFVGFLATLALTARAGRHLRSPMWTPLLLVVALTGPLLFYSTSAFGEMLSAALVLGCIVAVLERQPALIFLLALVGGLGKETLPPFIVLIGVVTGRGDADRWLPPRRVLLPLLGGSAASVAAAGLFNQFRYGSWRNQNYLQPAFRISRVRAARNLWNLLVAPDGGVAWFWPSMSLLLVGLAVVAGVGLRRRSRASSGRNRSTVPSLVILATFVAMMLGLASWYAPFGWVAWGPRLTLPLLPALAVAAAHAGGEPLDVAVAAVLRRTATLTVVLVIVLAGSWPQAGAPWQADRLARLIQIRDCSVSPRSHSEAFYDCEDRVAWRRHDNQLIEASSGGGTAGYAAQLTLLVAAAFFVLDARSRAMPDGSAQAVDGGGGSSASSDAGTAVRSNT